MAEVVLTPELLDELADVAERAGLLRLAAVPLEHPGFEAAREALDRFLDAGREGEMGFMSRTREVRKDPTQMLPGARSLIVVAVPYAGGDNGIARYAQGADYHSVLHRRFEPVLDHLKSRLPGVEATVCVDTKPVMERAAAALAGLGFVGKHGCVIVPGLGSYVLLGEILCTAALADDAPPSPDLGKTLWDACGSCRRCLDACPTQAFDAPGELDPRRCISYLTIEHRGSIDDTLADHMGDWIVGCDVCQEVCPYNAGEKRRDKAPTSAWLESPPAGPPSPDLPTLANIGSSRYRAFVRDTALRRIPRRAMRRNALLALGNREGPLDGVEEAAVVEAESSDEPLVQAAAQRATRRRARG